jgi:hypothetical protein
MRRALAADVLTSSRMLLAVVVAGAIGAGSLDWAAVLVPAAWLTDFFDGRLARSADRPTRLRAWDLRADTLLGIGIMVGMAWGGFMPWWTVPLLATAMAGATHVLGNPSPAMLLLGYVYAWFLWLMLVEAELLGWVPFATLPFLLVFDWHRFTKIILPAFFKGAAALFRGDRSATDEPVLDDWV